MDALARLASHLRSLRDLPVLIPPFASGVNPMGKSSRGFAGHAKECRHLFSRIRDVVKIVAFPDGVVPLSELSETLTFYRSLADEFGLELWSRVESSERKTPPPFLPIDFPTLRYKLETAHRTGSEKLVTFEFPHFLNPYSSYLSARNLNQRYHQWLKHQEK